MAKRVVLMLALAGLLVSVPQASARRHSCGKVGGWEVSARHISCSEARTEVAAWQATDLSVCIPFGCRVRGYSCHWRHRDHLVCRRGRRAAIARP
ncbi:MAG TPA: hypothetical protein VGN78_06410 [Solirubrobacteraceae bacterium]|jgi:hypothetical protein|nr:hypothetical protein [Solirubrobacteraceae bacterium]